MGRAFAFADVAIEHNEIVGEQLVERVKLGIEFHVELVNPAIQPPPDCPENTEHHQKRNQINPRHCRSPFCFLILSVMRQMSIVMDTDERLQRIESDIHEMKADMSDIKVSLAEIKATLPHVATKESVAKIETTLESTLPHLATKAEVEEAKHVSPP